MEYDAVRCDKGLLNELRGALAERYAERLSAKTEVVGGVPLVTGFSDIEFMKRHGVGFSHVPKMQLVNSALVQAIAAAKDPSKRFPWD